MDTAFELETKRLIKAWVIDKDASYILPEKDNLQLSSSNINPIEQIIKRNNQENSNGFVCLFAGDDMKKEKPLQSVFLRNSEDVKKFKEEINNLDMSTYGVFMTFNPLTKPERKKIYVSKLLYVFIDLDDAKEVHNELIKDTLKKYNITYSYNAKSGGGFHFLVPINLEIEQEDKIKGFLNYLKSNVCDKVDIATADAGRLLRIPESYHKKQSPEIQLQTLHSHYPTEEEIIYNSANILSYQLEYKKGVKDVQYKNTIKKTDLFFSHILNSFKSWKDYINYLKSANERNNIFLKNLGIFLRDNQNYMTNATNFIDSWESSRNQCLGGWIKKATDNNFEVNYLELYKWAVKYNLIEFQELLKEQLKDCFLDKYEFYYLEDEKKENAYLMYYPEKNYYVTKSLNDMITNIYYDCIECGVDLEEEFQVTQTIDKYEEKSFKDKLTILKGLINSKLHKEKRIKLVYNINYEPSDSKFCYFNKKKFFNIYNPTDLWSYKNVTETYNFPSIKELLMNLCNNNEEYYNYLNKWLGWIIQNPTEKLPTAIILQGKQGSGKGTLKNLILDNIFGENCQEINQTHLESNFSGYLLGKQIIVANEVMHNENRQTLPNVLKNLVTDEKITINRKFKNEIVCKNYSHWIFCTNSDNPIKIDEDDRRYSVFYSEKLRKNLGKELRDNLEHELKEYISYLKSLKIDFFDVSEPIMTQAKEDIIDLNKDSIQRFFEHLQIYQSYLDAHIKLFGNDSELGLIKTDAGTEFIITENFFLLYKRWAEKYKESGIFGKQNFSKKISCKGITIENKWNKVKSVRTYPLDRIENIINNKQLN